MHLVLWGKSPFRYIRLVITGVYCIRESPHIHCILLRESNSNITGYQIETE